MGKIKWKDPQLFPLGSKGVLYYKGIEPLPDKPDFRTVTEKQLNRLEDRLAELKSRWHPLYEIEAAEDWRGGQTGFTPKGGGE